MAKGKFGAGRSATKFSYTFSDIATILGLKQENVRKHAQRGNFNPRDLISVLEFIQKQTDKQRKLEEKLSQYPIKVHQIKKK